MLRSAPCSRSVGGCRANVATGGANTTTATSSQKARRHIFEFIRSSVETTTYWVYNAAQSSTGQKRNREQHPRRDGHPPRSSEKDLRGECGGNARYPSRLRNRARNCSISDWPESACKRIGTELNLDGLGTISLSSLEVEHRPRAVG